MTEHPTQTGNSPASALADAVWRRWRSPVVVWVLWCVNVAALGALVAWIFYDGQFSSAVLALKAHFAARFGNGADVRLWPPVAGRVWALIGIGTLAIGSGVGIFLGLFFGATTHRRLRSWFAFTMLIASWLTLLALWHELAWRGQVRRLQNCLDGFETVAASLRSDWPRVDGERPNVGQFMAYPIGCPTMLLMLTRPHVTHTNTTFSSVEHPADGALRFELIGDEAGVWLEWHPPGSVPQSFIGGLQDKNTLDRFEPLGQGWFVVRYEPGWNTRGPRSLLWPEGNN